MIFLSAGHHNADPGAVANGHKEADIAKRIRDGVIKHLAAMGAPYVKDSDSETLGQYLARIKPGTASVVLEFHLDAAANAAATGTTAIVADGASSESHAFAKELAEATSCVLGIKNRGVKPESWSARGRLGLMRKPGTVCLLEVCFITNKSDLDALLTPALFDALCLKYAQVIKKYEDLIK